MIEWFAPERSDARAAAFIDRDGVLNEHIAGGYVLKAEDFRWLPGAVDSVRRLGESGLAVIVVTNQSCINRGLIEKSTFTAIMHDMVRILQLSGVACSGWICCPHRPDEGCACRKPGTAMLERAAEITGVDLPRSVLVGDSTSDVEAAGRAGMNGILIERNSPSAFAAAVDRIVGGAA